MLSRRITYAFILLASVGVFIMTDNNIALFFCVLFCVLPILFLIQLFIAARRVTFDFSASSSCMRGKALVVTAKIGLSPRFLAGSAKVVLEIENTTFHKTELRTFIYNDLSGDAYNFDFVSENSGRIVIKIKEIKLLDWLGLCSVKVKNSRYEEAIVAPILYDNVIVRLGESGQSYLSGETVLPKKGSDRSEIFNIRSYVDGDPLNTIHWKLSGKFDKLKVKEFSSTEDNHAMILIDMSRKKWGYEANDKQLNCILDAAISMSGSLISFGVAHSVGWFGDGEFCHSQVNDGESLVAMINALMSVKVEEGNAETLMYYTRTDTSQYYQKVIFLTPAIRPEEWKLLEKEHITAIAINDDTTQEFRLGGAKILNVPCDEFPKYISEYEL